ncbi:MAG: hypothetical protein WC460_06815 [Patescibacteria group bacterium]
MAEEKRLDVMDNQDKSQVLDVLDEDIKSKIGNAFTKIKGENENPTIGMGISFIGDNNIVLYVNSFANHLNNEQQKRDAANYAYSVIDGLTKKLKEVLKKEYDVTISPKIMAENYDVECISLNGRFKITVKKMYQI